ncbi:hypothetical protein [Larkinella rosea]|uniref:DUF4890 domain-containing protein n=1 Tax=Larkinella rosea TaxID=2025312 RepID=A0A3P1BZY8_9BACT|nr:hypothetical protein [Larkinella rosea]RRB06647.1 hypothetical protein EHT25_02295 [Larkinella rosea]
MKTKLLKTALFLIILMSGTASFAQRGNLGTPEERAASLTTKMKEKLNLTADQEVPVAEINLKYARQNQSLLETGGRNMRTARQVQNSLKEKDRELKNVLNADQYKQYQVLKEEMKAELKQRRRQK